MDKKYKHVETPLLGHYKKLKSLNNKDVFRLTKDDLMLFFEKKNIKKPVNEGECRVSLNILRDCGYHQGLCQLLNTDPEMGIVGGCEDLLRREKAFGKHFIAVPKI